MQMIGPRNVLTLLSLRFWSKRYFLKTLAFWNTGLWHQSRIFLNGPERQWENKLPLDHALINHYLFLSLRVINQQKIFLFRKLPIKSRKSADNLRKNYAKHPPKRKQTFTVWISACQPILQSREVIWLVVFHVAERTLTLLCMFFLLIDSR